MNVIVDIWVLKTSTFKMITFIFYDIVLIVANLLDVNRHQNYDVSQTLIISHEYEDKWVWHFDSISMYTFKSGYFIALAHKCNRSSSSVSGWKT